MAIRNFDEFIEANDEWKFKLACCKVENGAG
jgi:hypothetical protein